MVAKLVAVFAVAVLMATACVDGSDDAESTESTDVVESTTTEAGADDQESTTASEEVDDQSGLTAEPLGWEYQRVELLSGLDQPRPIQARVGPAPVILETGRYETDVLGMPFSFEVPEPLRLHLEVANLLALVDPSSSELVPTESFGISRIVDYPDPARIGVGPPGAPPAVDGYRMESWLAEVPQITAVGAEDLEIAGYPARSFALVVDPAAGPTWPCGSTLQCIEFANDNDIGQPIVLEADKVFQAWVVDLGPEWEELLILASAANGGGAERWMALVAEVVDSIELGEPGPTVYVDRPWERGIGFTTIPPGPVELPIGPGVRFDLDRPVEVNLQAGWAYMTIDADSLSYPPNVEVVTATHDLEGGPIDSVSRLVELLEEVGGSETGTVQVDGREAAVVELPGVEADRPVFLQTEPYDDLPTEPITWWTQDYVRFVIFETAEGVMALTAEGEDADGLAIAVELQDQVIATLEVQDG